MDTGHKVAAAWSWHVTYLFYWGNECSILHVCSWLRNH